MPKYTFRKNERINYKKIIDQLFDRKSKGNASFLVYPIKVIVFKEEISQPKVDVVISVSSRKFKRAVDRNLIKRRIRESYRLNKPDVPYTCHLAFIYVAELIEDFNKIEKSVKKISQKLAE